KLGGYVYAYREDMARILALLKFLIYNLYVAIFLFIVRKGYSKVIQKYFIIFLYLFFDFGLVSYYF
ncbi:hypothetical protein, partial [Thermosipho sp. 1223]|uniref:hypothetical protein n=1 Tax=Thermosipho sp. 1223 TaxID=1643332 RepID=UPI0009D2BBCF